MCFNDGVKKKCCLSSTDYWVSKLVVFSPECAEQMKPAALSPTELALFSSFFWRSNTLQPHTPVNSTPTRASFLVCNKPPAHQRHLSKETITFNLYINSIGQRKKRGGGKSPDNQSVATEAKKRHKAHISPLPPSHISLFSVIPVFHLPTATTVESRARIYSLSHFSVIFSH